MTHDEDATTRRRALTELDRTMLVEAGAGAGKTSILAGRVVALMASAGRRPAEIAAITFTEAGAGELATRVRSFVEALLGAVVPPDLSYAFAGGLSEAQRAALKAAHRDLDDLTCCTIHGFCRVLLAEASVEASVDPGASMADREASDRLLEEALHGHLRERLSEVVASDDLLVASFVDDPATTYKTLTSIAARLRARPDLVAPTSGARGPEWLVERVRAFREFVDGAGRGEPMTAAFAGAFEEQIEGLTSDPERDAAALVRVARMGTPERCATAAGGFRAYRAKARWEAAARPAEAGRLCAEATLRYDECREAHGAAREWAAAKVLDCLFAEARAVLARFAREKGRRALLDFDDLLLRARDMLAARRDVRERLAARFGVLLVDEFQDTDRVQCEVLWRLSSLPPSKRWDAPWREWVPRPGSLFFVGDPQQAIYRFRDADVATYVAVRAALFAEDPKSVARVTRNFRSGERILDWANERFKEALDAPGQPGFAALECGAVGRDAAVVALDIGPCARDAAAIRDAEAEAVAYLCESLIGRHPVPVAGGDRMCAPEDIALLAPSGTETWRYEAALRRRGISTSCRVGNGFFRRQEVQDLVALSRALADPADTLALGALLRGPLVGLTEEELLDATAALPDGDGRRPRLDLATPLEHVGHPLLRETLCILRDLVRRATSTTPHAVLCEAVSELRVRAVLIGRHDDPRQALANVDLLLEMSRAFDVRGFASFATAMARAWNEGVPVAEASSDADGAVRLVTMHGAKGLEWPVVVPINTATRLVSRLDFALERERAVLHVPVFGGFLPGATKAIDREGRELALERHRLLYVAATRARSLLVLPRLPFEVPRSWAALLGPLMSLQRWEAKPVVPTPRDALIPMTPAPDAETFRAQERAIRSNANSMRRVSPHRAGPARGEAAEWALGAVGGWSDGGDLSASDGLFRGSVVHSLIEDVLAGVLPENFEALSDRACRVASDLCVETFCAEEAASYALRALAAVAPLRCRYRIVSEYPVCASSKEGGAEEVTLGFADAVALDVDDRVALVLEWKTDDAPSSSTIERYLVQVRTYVRATGATEGIIVFASNGKTLRVPARGTRSRIVRSRSNGARTSQREAVDGAT